MLSEEELGNKLFTYLLPPTEYAARIHNLRSFDAVSRDLMQRWAFPFVPDTNVLWLKGAWGASSYRYARGQRYSEANISQARTAVLGEDVCVGAGSSIGEHSYVAQSVIGRNVRIGKGCIVVGAYIQVGGAGAHARMHACVCCVCCALRWVPRVGRAACMHASERRRRRRCFHDGHDGDGCGFGGRIWHGGDGCTGSLASLLQQRCRAWPALPRMCRTRRCWRTASWCAAR